MRPHNQPYLMQRWLMIAGLALGLVLQPVLASVGELHELTHSMTSAHDTPNTVLPAGEEGSGATLHQIHHLIHCCGHAVMSPSGALVMPALRHHDTTNQVSLMPVSRGRWVAPFRPPITG